MRMILILFEEGLKVRKWNEIDFFVKHFASRFDCVAVVVLILKCGYVLL